MNTRTTMKNASATTHATSGGRLVSLQGLDLPLRSVDLAGRARAGTARTVLTQTFANTHPEPLEAVYTMPLPAEGAVAGYTIRIGETVLRGVIEKREAAREMYERAMVEGRTAGLVEQERVNLFTQKVGNIPPGAVVVVEITVDQRLAWIEGGFWEWRFPTVVAPRYMGAEGRVGDAEAVTVDVAETPMPVRVLATLRIGDRLRTADGTGSALPESPSHDIVFAGEAVSLAGEGVRLDRDIVVRWPVAGAGEGIGLVTARPEGPAAHAYGLLTVVPPATRPPSLPRDLIVLIDTSGSMTGRPIERAREIVGALIDTLGESDRLELIAFGMSPRRWRPEAVAGSDANRRDARAWVEALQANGGTEMTAAMLEALRPLAPDAVRQVVLVTDGLIGFETEIVRSVLAGLPAGSRLHTVGVGSAVNRALTRPAARAGRGVEVMAGLDGSAGDAVRRLIAATEAPVIVDLEVTGDAVAGVAPRRPADLMAGAPVLIGLKLSPGGGTLVARGRTASGAWEKTLTVPPARPGDGDDLVVTLYGREAVEDLETDLAGGAGSRGIDEEVQRLGLGLGIATRLTSWVAVGEEPTVDPLRPVRRTRIPQELPHGMSAEGLGLRASMGDRMIGRMYESLRDGVDFRLTRENIRQIESKALRKLRHPTGWRRLRRFLEDQTGMTGRWTVRLDERWRYFEIEVRGGELDWRPGSDFEVVLISHLGQSRTVSCDLARSTEPGMIGVGDVIRLLLEVDEETVRDAVAAEFEVHGTRLTIRL